MHDGERKVALVTGAGSGIGEGAARALAAQGYHAVVVGHGLEDAEAVAAAIRADGGAASALGCDVEEAASVRDVVARVEHDLGRIDVVVAAAGINGVWAPVEEIEPEEWERTIAVNLTGTFHTVRYAVPLLKVRGGSVVIISSINGSRTFSNSGASAYSASKAGQVAFAKMIAVELGEHGVRVNVICPGAIATEIDDNTHARHTENLGVAASYPDGTSPLTGDEPGSSAQVADLVCFLVSDASSHITGTEIYIDGGQSLVA